MEENQAIGDSKGHPGHLDIRRSYLWRLWDGRGVPDDRMPAGLELRGRAARMQLGGADGSQESD